MKKGKYLTPRNAKRTNKKLVSLMLALALCIGCVVGGTLAWLTDQTVDVTNTFTASDIEIDLKETTADFKMVPGCDIEKDPVVTVKAGSEDCWVFIKVEETGVTFTPEGDTMPKVYSFDDFISYEIDPNNWEQLKDEAGNPVAGVYVTKAPVKDVTADRSIKVLGYYDENGTFVNNKVLVKDTVTKEMMNLLNEDTYPTLTFTAYAVQLMQNNTEEFTAAEAWKEISGT